MASYTTTEEVFTSIVCKEIESRKMLVFPEFTRVYSLLYSFMILLRETMCIDIFGLNCSVGVIDQDSREKNLSPFLKFLKDSFCTFWERVSTAIIYNKNFLREKLFVFICGSIVISLYRRF